jgi:hypothetical protein
MYQEGNGGAVPVDTTVFADDLSLYQHTAEGMQKVVDGVLLFCGLTGMRCNVDKTRWMSLNGAGQLPHSEPLAPLCPTCR